MSGPLQVKVVSNSLCSISTELLHQNVTRNEIMANTPCKDNTLQSRSTEVARESNDLEENVRGLFCP